MTASLLKSMYVREEIDMSALVICIDEIELAQATLPQTVDSIGASLKAIQKAIFNSVLLDLYQLG